MGNDMNKIRAMAQWVLLSLLFAGSAGLQAQDCMQKAKSQPGVWVREKNAPPHSEQNASTRNFVRQITAQVDSICALFIRTYPHPHGSKVGWTRVLQPPDSLTLPDPALASYLFSAPFQPYVCQNNKIVPYINANTWLIVSINDYYNSGYIPCKEPNADLHENLFFLPPQRFSLAGFPGFETLAKGTADNPREIRYSVMVHKKAVLPFVPVSRKEFFELCRRMMEVSEEKFRKEFQHFKDIGIPVSKEDEDRLRDRFSEMRNQLSRQLKLSEKKLEEPAVLISPYLSISDLENALSGDLLFTSIQRGYQLVRSNPAYVNRQKEKWKPQFMWVSWSVRHDGFYEENTAQLDNMIRNQFDFGSLEKICER